MSLLAVALSCVAGLSTALGGLFVIYVGQPGVKKLGHLLSFSSGVMLFISFIDLLPEAINAVGFANANIAFFAGMIFFKLVTSLVPEPSPEFILRHFPPSHPRRPSKLDSASRLEQGGGEPYDGDKYAKRNSDLVYLGIVTALGISLHNFPEGVAVYLTALRGMSMGLPLTLAIAVHNIPEGMAVAAPIYHATKNRWQAFKWTLISGLCEPAGAIFVGIVFAPWLTPTVVKTLLAGVAGIMAFMCFSELIPSSFKYITPTEALYSNVAGMMAISFSVWFLQEYMGFKT